jgi:hypothetical protein
MPYKTEWVEPETFVVVNGLPIYHTYKNDDIDEVRSTFYYTTDIRGEYGDDDSSFDIRKFPHYGDVVSPKPYEYENMIDFMDAQMAYIKKVIEIAVEQNLVN